jgi:predicted  nucleic acid-binding Zn-ribbon protein
MDESQRSSLGGNGDAIIARAKITTNEVNTKEAAASLQAKFDSIEKELATQRDQNAQLMKLLTAKAEERIKEELAVESVVSRALEASEEVSDIAKRGRGRPRKDG